MSDGWSRVRLVLFLVGALSVLLAVVSWLLLESGPGVGVSRIQSGVAFLFIGFLLIVFLTRRKTVHHDPPDLDRSYPTAVVGSEIDDVLRSGDVEKRGLFLDELREIALERLMARGYEEEEARDALRRGEWTDDDRAAALLGEDEFTAPSLALRLHDWLFLSDSFDVYVERAIEEIGGI